MDLFKSLEDIKDELETGVFVFTNFSTNAENYFVEGLAQKLQDLKDMLRNKREKFNLDDLQR